MSAGLAASTVTPGSTAPDESFTLPAKPACAKTTEGSARMLESTNPANANLRMLCLLNRLLTNADDELRRMSPRHADRHARVKNVPRMSVTCRCRDNFTASLLSVYCGSTVK